jgi:hypothetical protein
VSGVRLKLIFLFELFAYIKSHGRSGVLSALSVASPDDPPSQSGDQ